MEYIAIAKNIKISPRKVRLVADGVKNKNLTAAFSALSVMSKRAAWPIRKAIDSAIANATNNFSAKRDELSIRDIIIGEGIAMKRYHFAGRGRTRPYKRRTSQIRVILTDNKLKTARPASLGEAGENLKQETIPPSREASAGKGGKK